MKKFYQKKDLPIEQSPLTLQLQRRHTVVESDKNSSAVVPKLRPVSRSNSTSSIYRPPKSAKDLSSQKGYLESTLSADSSGSSSASTLVITECQLSSSWLYNNKKAQMRSNETSELSTQQASDNEEGKYPSVHRSKVNPVSSPNRSSKKGISRCCYVAIVILAVLAVMGTITTIGGIVYMELFSGSNKTQTLMSGPSEIGRSEDLSYKKKIGYSLEPGRNYISKDLMPKEEEIMDSSSESKRGLEALNHFKDSKSINVENKQSSGTILRVKKVKDIIPITETDISGSLIQMTSEQELPEESNKKRSFPFVVPSFDRKSDSPYSKLFELYKGIRTALASSLEESSSFEEDQSNSKINDLTDSKADTSDLPENNTSELAYHHETDSDSIDSSKDSLKPDSIKEDPSEIEPQPTVQSGKSSNKSLDSNDFSQQPLKPDLMRNDTSQLEHQLGIEINTDSRHLDKSLDSNNSSKESLKQDSIKSDNSEFKHQHEKGIDKDLQSPDKSFNSNDSSNESLKSNLDLKLDASRTPIEVLNPPIPKYFFQRPTEGTNVSSRNTAGINEGSDDTNVEVQSSVRRFLPLIPKPSDDSNESITGELSIKNKDAFFDPKDSVSREIDSDLNASHVPSGEVLEPAIPKNFFQLPSKDAGQAFRNMFDTNEISDMGNSEEQSFPRFLPQIPQLSDQNDANDNVAESNQESDLPLELNRPISEAKIAFPGPLDLLRRFTGGRQSDKKESEVDQHDRRFSLAQALERLRSLDVRNVLPSSRQKTDSKKKPKPKLEPKVQNEQEVVTERSTYLQKLRRRFFDQ